MAFKAFFFEGPRTVQMLAKKKVFTGIYECLWWDQLVEETGVGVDGELPTKESEWFRAHSN